MTTFFGLVILIWLQAVSNDRQFFVFKNQADNIQFLPQIKKLVLKWEKIIKVL